MILAEAAKQFLLAYFADGKVRQPEHFDKEILGVDSFPAVLNILSGQEPAWNKTIFCDALGELVKEGKIKAWLEETGWYYQYDPTIKI
jgi:hypothetical protein